MTVTRDEVTTALARLGIAAPDPALVDKAAELNGGLRSALARIPRNLGKDVEPAHVFSVPLR